MRRVTVRRRDGMLVGSVWPMRCCSVGGVETRSLCFRPVFLHLCGRQGRCDPSAHFISSRRGFGDTEQSSLPRQQQQNSPTTTTVRPQDRSVIGTRTRGRPVSHTTVAASDISLRLANSQRGLGGKSCQVRTRSHWGSLIVFYDSTRAQITRRSGRRGSGCWGLYRRGRVVDEAVCSVSVPSRLAQV